MPLPLPLSRCSVQHRALVIHIESLMLMGSAPLIDAKLCNVFDSTHDHVLLLRDRGSWGSYKECKKFVWILQGISEVVRVAHRLLL